MDHDGCLIAPRAMLTSRAIAWATDARTTRTRSSITSPSWWNQPVGLAVTANITTQMRVVDGRVLLLSSPAPGRRRGHENKAEQADDESETNEICVRSNERNRVGRSVFWLAVLQHARRLAPCRPAHAH